MNISTYCKHCDKAFKITVVEQDYEDWKAGKWIQNAMPYLTVDQRELLISGICGNCFDAIFAEDDNLTVGEIR